MKAKVRESYFLPTAQSAGMEFVKGEWRVVPEHAEAEIAAAPFLEIEGEAKVDPVAILGEPDDQVEPVIPESAEEAELLGEEEAEAEAEAELPFWMPELLDELELEEPAGLAGVSDDDILAVDGVGKARLRDIREIYPGQEE